MLNAGIYWPQTATAFRADDVHEMFRVNVGGIAEGLEAILPRMIDAGQGADLPMARRGLSRFADRAAYSGPGSGHRHG